MRRLRSMALGGIALSLSFLPLAGGSSFNTAQNAGPVPPAMSAPTATSDSAAGTAGYAGDAVNEARLTAAEDQRLFRVRQVGVTARMRGEKLLSPYLVTDGQSRTLVLTPRPAAYVPADLQSLAGEYFVREADGAYFLGENVVIQAGAGLSLTAPGGLTLHLASTASGFVSIVNDGGKLDINGTPDAPVMVTSWDRDKGAINTDTSHGRAYLRSIGGTTTITNARIDSLGFWAGRTGGVAITGTDRPTSQAQNTPKTPRSPSTKAAVPPTPGIRTLEADPRESPDNYATASIRDTTISGNAFGIFVTKSRGMEISHVAVQNSLVDGVVLHRFVTGARVTETTSSHNAGNGFVLARATAEITLTHAGADLNGRSGILLRGQPLSDGPSAGGDLASVSSGHTVSGSHAEGNRRYGIEVVGCRNIELHDNTITGNDRGIDLSHAVSGATIDGNRFENQKTRSVSVTDGAADTVVAANSINGGKTAIYLRNSPGIVTRNSMTGLTNHGITVLGHSPVRLFRNVITGSGPSALDLRDNRSSVLQSENDVSGWNKTAPFWVQVANFFQPLTIIWTLLALLLAFTAFKGLRGRRRVVHPYAKQAPLAAFTSGGLPFAGPPQSPGTQRTWDSSDSTGNRR
ncbi:hypothetical protein GCM10027405_15180 [Arthrobacter alkaliphilus]|uniref:right-handed parallel beta-helix repeat-containing protein n=1 Tax=Arthrobacter alkaliphilus TaxID=369936 RepID=UPI001F485E6F|nr:right-handed parallel beta-helix repeat-containing protein [Arthrobacter alkaliphilus]